MITNVLPPFFGSQCTYITKAAPHPSRLNTLLCCCLLGIMQLYAAVKGITHIWAFDSPDGFQDGQPTPTKH